MSRVSSILMTSESIRHRLCIVQPKVTLLRGLLLYLGTYLAKYQDVCILIVYEVGADVGPKRVKPIKSATSIIPRIGQVKEVRSSTEAETADSAPEVR